MRCRAVPQLVLPAKNTLAAKWQPHFGTVAVASLR